MATVDITNWDEKNTASVGNLSDSSSFTGLQKVQPVKVNFNSGTRGGTGDAHFTVDVDSQSEIVVTESDESTTRPYEVESLSNGVAWIWVYGSWDSDDSDQIVIGAGGNGNGTDYSSGGTGSNPWGQTGVNSQLVYLFNESSGQAVDSSPNGFDSSSTTGTTFDVAGQENGARDFDGIDDKIVMGKNLFANSDFNNGLTIATAVKPDNKTELGTIVSFERGWGIRINDVSNGDVSFKVDGSSTDSTNSTGDVLTADQFSSIVATDDANNSQEIFHNGTSENTSSESRYDLTSLDRDQVIGARDNGSPFINAAIDVFRLFNDVKSSNWATADYDSLPIGGQVFFSWNGPQKTDRKTEIGFVRQARI